MGLTNSSGIEGGRRVGHYVKYFILNSILRAGASSSGDFASI